MKERVPVSNKETAEDRLLNFVEEQTDKFTKYTSLAYSGSGPSYFVLNEALCNYSSIQLALASTGVMAKLDLQRKQDAFDEWFSQKYTEERYRENPREISAQKWIGSKEIEMLVRTENKEEFQRLNGEVKAAEMKVAYIRRLQDTWDGFKFVLTRLCRNADAEASLSSKIFPDMAPDY